MEVSLRDHEERSRWILGTWDLIIRARDWRVSEVWRVTVLRNSRNSRK